MDILHLAAHCRNVPVTSTLGLTMRCAQVLRLPKRIVVHAMNKAISGIWIAAEPYITLPVDAPVGSIADAVLVSTRASKEGVALPDDWKAFSKIRLAAAGVRSEAELLLGVCMVHVEIDEDRAVVVPSRNGGSKGLDKGFHVLASQAVETSLEQHALGSAIVHAFEECAQ